MRRAKQLSGGLKRSKGYRANNAWIVTVHNVIGPVGLASWLAC